MTKVAYETVRDRIVRGEYAPGQRLPAAEIAASLGMSRTPIRESLLLLESEGLVSSALNRGSRVRPLSREIISNLYELRAMLEGFAARKAAESVGRVPPEDVDALRAAMREFDELVANRELHSPGNIAAMMAANSRIHDTIVFWSGYAQLSGLIAQTIDRGVIYRAFDLFSRQDLERINDFHRMIVERVTAGDADRASSLMSEHVFQSRDVVLQRIDAAGGDVKAVFESPLWAGRRRPA